MERFQPESTQSEYFEKQLYTPRSLEGEPNTEELADVRLVYDKLSEIPTFVSVIPKGSLVHGYSNPQSDLDLAILYDSASAEYNAPEYWQQREELMEVANSAKEDIWDIKRAHNDQLRKISFRFFDINNEKLESFVFSQGRYDELAQIFQLSTGDRLGTYRDYWKDKLNSLPIEIKESIVQKLVDKIVDDFQGSDINYKKLQQRLPNVDGDTLRNKRREMWINRINNMLNSAESEI